MIQTISGETWSIPCGSRSEAIDDLLGHGGFVPRSTLYQSHAARIRLGRLCFGTRGHTERVQRVRRIEEHERVVAMGQHRRHVVAEMFEFRVVDTQ
jgi:hypothetical protein